MKRIILAAAVAAVTTQVTAADVGIGASVQSNDSWIYVPIDINSKLRLEPSLRFIDAESQSRTEDSSFGLPITTTVKSDGTTYELALGIFGLVPIAESARLYYGGRIAYIDSESEIHIHQLFGNFEEQSVQKTSSDGYRLSPTLGFEYLFNEHFSIGGEAEWFYQDVDSTRDQTDVASIEGGSKSSGTDTRLIVRFRF